MSHSYNDKQLQMLRDALNAYRFSNGKPYSWESISEAIQEKTGVYIPSKNLPKFVNGIPHRNPIKKARGERRYSNDLGNNGLNHILTFLTDDDDILWLSRESFNQSKETIRWPLPLKDYLNNKKEMHILNRDYLKGMYYSHAMNDTYVLTIDSSEISDVLSFELNSVEQGENFLGYIMMSSEEQIFLIGKEADTQETLIYICKGFDNQLRRDLPPYALALQEQSYPDDRFGLIDDLNDFVEQAQKDFLDNLHIYQRNEKVVDFSEEVN